MEKHDIRQEVLKSKKYRDLEKSSKSTSIVKSTAPLDSLITQHSLSSLKCHLCTLEKEVKLLKSKTQTSSLSLEKKATNVEVSTKKEIDTLSSLISTFGKKILTLEENITRISQSLLESLTPKKEVPLTVGKKFNLLEQPEVVKEGGIHRVSPISLVVNGGVVLHDIGYTTEKKNLLPLYFDPSSERLVLYRGK